jgi:hypothetical protein
LIAHKSFQENSDSLRAVTAAFAPIKSRLSDGLFGGADTSMNKWLDPENHPMAKWLNPENSAMGKFAISLYLI